MTKDNLTASSLDTDINLSSKNKDPSVKDPSVKKVVEKLVVPNKVSDISNESKPSIVQSENLPSHIFKVEINNQAIFNTVVAERASQRQGTHKTKQRSEKRGGGRKPFRQKGTGRARAGSTRSPIWVGGGVVFGPTPERNYNLKVNKKIRKIALNSALSLKAQDKAILSYEFMLEKPSTKNLLKQIKDLNLNKTWKKILIVSENPLIYKSASNVKNLWVNKWTSLHVEEILNADAIIFAPQILERLNK